MNGAPSSTRAIAVCFAIILSASVSSDADADAGFLVTVTSVGPKPILVEVAAGLVAPCDGDGDEMLYRGPLLPNTAARMRSPLPVVCFRHTFDGFPTVDWSQSTFHRTPLECVGWGRSRRCFPIPGAAIRITVRSNEP